MPVTYTNRKKQHYYLCQGTTRTGKPRYYFAREPKDAVMEKIPDGYQIQESVNGIVSLVRIQPSLLSIEDINAVEAAVQNHPHAKRYRVSIKAKQITIHEQVGPDTLELVELLGLRTVSESQSQWLTDRAQFRPIMRFTMTDVAKHLFTAERWCFRGSVDDWINIDHNQSVSLLAAKYVPTLGTDEFYELFSWGRLS